MYLLSFMGVIEGIEIRIKRVGFELFRLFCELGNFWFFLGFSFLFGKGGVFVS